MRQDAGHDDHQQSAPRCSPLVDRARIGCRPLDWREVKMSGTNIEPIVSDSPAQRAASGEALKNNEPNRDVDFDVDFLTNIRQIGNELLQKSDIISTLEDNLEILI